MEVGLDERSLDTDSTTTTQSLPSLPRYVEDPLGYRGDSEKRHQAALYGATFVCLVLLEQWLEVAQRPANDVVEAMAQVLRCHEEDADDFSQQNKSNNNVQLDSLFREVLNNPVEELTQLTELVKETRRLLWQRAPDPAPDAHLAVQTSQIPGAALGLFATRRLSRGTVCTYYSGDVHSAKSSQQLSDASYLLRVAGSVASRPWWYTALQASDNNKEKVDAQDMFTRLGKEWNILVDRGCTHGRELFVNPTCLGIKARYINDCLDPERWNVKYVLDSRTERAAVVALRDIHAGEELFVSYGETYWASWQAVTGAVPKRLPFNREK